MPLVGTMERFDVFSEFRSNRIPGVKHFGNSLVSLGIMYYSIKR